MRPLRFRSPFAWALPAKAPTPVSAHRQEEAATALSSLIATARRQAIADGVSAIPPVIYRALLGFFPADVLSRVRYAVGAIAPLSLPSFAVTYGDARAITLGDVVLFKTERGAQTDAALWVHALTHVMQYQRWGMAGFAERAVRDGAALEQEAIEAGSRFCRWRADAA